MVIASIIGWLIVGLIVGAIARLIVPGRQPIGIALTIVLGIVGAIVGGFIGSLLFGPNLLVAGDQVYEVQYAWPGWILAIIGATLVLWIVMAVSGGTTRRNL